MSIGELLEQAYAAMMAAYVDAIARKDLVLADKLAPVINEIDRRIQ